MEPNIRNGTPEQLHQLKDKVEELIDVSRAKLEQADERLVALEGATGDTKTAIEELAQVKGAHTTLTENLLTMNERLDELDKQLPKGEKIYRSIGTEEEKAERNAAARKEFASLILDGALIARHQKPRFSESIRSQTEFEGSGDEGGLLVPEEQLAEIVRIVESYGVARKLFRKVPMARNEMRIPTNSNLPATTWDTELTSTRELVAPSESQVNVARPALVAHKLIAIDTMSIEVIEDSIPLISDFVADLFAIAIAKEEDDTMFNSPGTGNEPWTDGGLLIDTAITQDIDAETGDDTYKKVLERTDANGGYAKLLTTMDTAEESTANTGFWVFSNSVLNGIRLVKDTTGVPLWGQMVAGPPGTIFGRPYVTSRVFPKMTDAGSQASKAFILYGDFRFVAFGDRQELRLDVSEHAAFKEYGMVMRVAERVAFKLLLATQFSRLVTAA